MRISVIIPTCFRYILFNNMLESLNRTTSRYDVEKVIVVDKDQASVGVAVGSSGSCILDYSIEMRGAIFAWNRGLSLCTGDIIVPAGDDQIFHDGWLDYALESHWEKLNGYGVVGMNDLAHGEEFATMFLFDRKFCKDHLGGVIAPPVYNYFYVDNEINEKARGLGRFYWDERSVVEHLHSSYGKRPVDEHDEKRMKENYMEFDKRMFEERKALGFPTTWEPVI